MSERGTFSVGIDLGGTSIRVGVYDASMRNVAQHSMPTRVSAGPQSAVEEMAAAIRMLCAELSAEDGTPRGLPSMDNVVGVGIGSPGPINLRTGLIELRRHACMTNAFGPRNLGRGPNGLCERGVTGLKSGAADQRKKPSAGISAVFAWLHLA